MVKSFGALLITLCAFNVFAQSSRPDLILQKAQQEANDSSRVRLWNEYVEAIRETDNTTALKYAEMAKNLAERISFQDGLGKALENIGWILYRKGNYSQSLLASTEALKISTSILNYELMSNCLNNVAAIHYEQKQFDLAMEKFKTALQVGEGHRLSKVVARSLSNIAFCFLGLHQLDSARKYAWQSIKKGIEINDANKIGFGYRVLGDISFEEGKWDEALKNYDECLKVTKQNDNNFLVSSTIHRMAKTNFSKGRTKVALEQLLGNIRLSNQLGYLNELELSYKLLSDIYYSQGNLPKAYEYQSRYTQLHDSLYNQRSAEQILVEQVQLESSIKQSQIDLLTKDALIRNKEIDNQRQLNYFFLISLSIVVALVIVLVNVNRRLKKVNRELESKNEQINIQAKQLGSLNATKDKLFSIIGHDLRSPVVSLRGLLELVNTSQLSQDEFIIFSKKLKNTLDYVHQDLDNLLTWARTQLSGFEANPQYGNLFKMVEEKCNLFAESTQIKGVRLLNKVPDDLEVFADMNHLSLILRNLIGNAVKFNNPGGSIEITSSLEGGVVTISVTDSGRGMTVEEIGRLFHIGTHFTKPGTHNEKGMGIGLLLVKEFVEKNRGSISVQSEMGKGTTFTITLKARKKEPQLA